MTPEEKERFRLAAEEMKKRGLLNPEPKPSTGEQPGSTRKRIRLKARQSNQTYPAKDVVGLPPALKKRMDRKDSH